MRKQGCGMSGFRSMGYRHIAAMAWGGSLLLGGHYAAAQGRETAPPVSTAATAGLPKQAAAAVSSFDPAHIRAHVQFLSNDLLEGRGPGQRGGEIAEQYIATQLMSYGVQPAGENGTYFQTVPLMAVHTDEKQTHMQLVPEHGAPIDLAYSTDYVTKDQTGATETDIDAPLVYVGYGIDAPEYKWNDYEGVDVKGKVVLLIVNEPPSDDNSFFTGKALTFYGRWDYKYEEAFRHGAVGVLIIHRTDLASYGWQVVRGSQAIEKSYLQGDPLSGLKAASWIQHSVADKLFAGQTDQEIEAAGKRGFKARELPVRVKAHIVSQVRRYNTRNVLGVIPGKDATHQAVFYSSHHDHLGVDRNASGDNIYNGAADNATGAGMLLETARVFATSAVTPPHSVYFAAVAAEEQGLLGSRYLGQHPPLPAGQIALALNYDMVLPLGIPESVQVTGAERTSFYPTLKKVADGFGLAIVPDSTPSAGFYYRSDHFSFARVGIPSFSIDEGDKFTGHDEAWGFKQNEDFNDNHYHQPSDEYKPEWDFRGLTRIDQFGYVLGWEALESKGSPKWNQGDEFEKPRLDSLK